MKGFSLLGSGMVLELSDLLVVTHLDRHGCKLQLDHLTVLLRIHVRSLENFQNLVLREKCIMGSSKCVWLDLFASIFYNLFLHMTLQFSQVTNTHIHTHFSPSSPLLLHISLDSSLSPSLSSFVRHLLPPSPPQAVTVPVRFRSDRERRGEFDSHPLINTQTHTCCPDM